MFLAKGCNALFINGYARHQSTSCTFALSIPRFQDIGSDSLMFSRIEWQKSHCCGWNSIVSFSLK
jgi:hypothetical protein